MTLQEMSNLLAEIPAIKAMLNELLYYHKANSQKKLYLKASEAKQYLQCSSTQLHRYVQAMRIERTDQGYNAYDLQQIYMGNKNYRTFDRPENWKELLKPILL